METVYIAQACEASRLSLLVHLAAATSTNFVTFAADECAIASVVSTVKQRPTAPAWQFSLHEMRVNQQLALLAQITNQ